MTTEALSRCCQQALDSHEQFIRQARLGDHFIKAVEHRTHVPTSYTSPTSKLARSTPSIVPCIRWEIRTRMLRRMMTERTTSRE
jgi:hypothetical protein